jgi:hypothetical protein
MRGLVLAACLSAAGVNSAQAQGFGNWYFEYMQADQAGELSVCNANIDFSNAWFSARLHGDEFDFVYYRADFTLPYDQVFGSVIFRVDGQSFTLTASTNARRADDKLNTAQLLFFEPRPADQGRLFSALKGGGYLWIEFPNGDYYEFPLRGSGRAFEMASECWANRPTGPFSNNPFQGGQGSGGSVGNNPFESL